ncbi:MAG: hypothetical protein VKN33_05265 [Candidatus Sericytochromatia bacterium]|nr:hypothetical protein [Candidatus Sericytochromatia bacterium]
MFASVEDSFSPMRTAWSPFFHFQVSLLFAFASGCAPVDAPPVGLAPEIKNVNLASKKSDDVKKVNSPIAENNGSLRGSVRVPIAGAIFQYTDQVKQNPLSGMLELRNSGDNALSSSLLAGTTPMGGARVVAFNSEGQAISKPVFTDERGQFEITSLRSSGPLIFVRASIQREQQNFVLVTAAPAPREARAVDILISPSSTLIAKKTVVAINNRLINPIVIRPSFLARVANLFSLVLSDRGLVAACILDDLTASRLFDEVVKSLPTNLLDDLQREARANDGESLLDPTPPNPQPGIPSPLPSVSPSPFFPSAPPSSGPGSGDSENTDSTLNPDASESTSIPGDPRGTLKTIAQIKPSQSRVEVKAGSAEIFVPAGSNLFTVQLGELDREVIPQTTDRAIRATCFNEGRQFDFDGREIFWADGAVPLFDIGQLAFVDMAVKDGFAYLTSVEDNNIYRVDLKDGFSEVFVGAPLAAGGFQDGSATGAEFFKPMGIVAASDALYVADAGNHRIRRVSYEGEVTTFAGGRPGTSDGRGIKASFQNPMDLTLDAQGLLYVADHDNHRIRRITPEGLVTTISNTERGNTDGTGKAATLEFPASLGHGVLDDTNILVILQSNGALRVLSNW